MSDRETLDVYAAQAAKYAGLTKKASKDPQLAAFMDALPEGAEVLDLGCGPGFAAAAMAEAGMHVTAMDPVAEMVALARQHEGVQAVQGGFDDIAGADVYDGVWANFCLLHAPRDDMPRHLAAIARALRTGGVFHIGMKLGEGAARDGIGRLYTYYSEEELVRLLEEAGLHVHARAYGRDLGLDGVMADWICLRAHA